MHNVAERRRFDQQNARELRGLQFCRIRILCPCVFDLAVQIDALEKGPFNVQRSTPNAQRPIQVVERWALDVGR
jgi:hypothetical protein